MNLRILQNLAEHIDAEEVMGMLSAKKSSCPNGSLAFISAQIRCRKNKIYEFMENNENLNNVLIYNSIKLASNYTKMTRLRSREIDTDILNRMILKIISKYKLNIIIIQVK